MEILKNPYRKRFEPLPGLLGIPYPSVDVATPRTLIARCSAAAETPLVAAPALAAQCDVGEVWVKDERDRMGLGSFKALGAAYVIAHEAQGCDVSKTTYVTASAGNHGMSVAAGARAFGARAVIYIAETVPEAFAERLRDKGAMVIRQGATYEASMAAASRAAEDCGWRLLSDSSWPGYVDVPHRLMEGYLVLMAEIFRQMPDPASHIFVQAGVGGLAGAVAAIARQEWGDVPVIAVVEPDAAPALKGSITAGRPVETPGPVSAMGRLDCKEPSLIALNGLARDADIFATITETEGHDGAEMADELGLPSTPSGAAGLSGLLASRPHRDVLGLGTGSRVLLIFSEGPEH